MRPLSRARRNLYLAALVAVFAVAAPLLVGYAQGYRLSDLGDALRLIRTGGVYVAAGESGVAVSVDGDLRETTTFLSRNALVQNLFAGEYHVEAAKPGYQTWAKDLSVYPELVTEWRPVLVPDPVVPTEILKTLPVATSTSATATPVAPRLNPEYPTVVALFASSTRSAGAGQARGAATSTERLATIDALAQAGRRDLEKKPTLKIVGDIAAWNDDGTLRYAWIGDPDATPYYLCAPASLAAASADPSAEDCVDESVVPLPNPVLAFDFLPERGDVFVVTTKTGAWLVEADGRGGRNVAQLMPGDGLDLRVANGSIYLRRAARYWEVGL